MRLAPLYLNLPFVFRLTLLLALLLGALTGQAQLRRGDSFITFGGNTSTALTAIDFPLGSDLVGLGRGRSLPGLNGAISPSYSTLATDWLELGVSVSAATSGNGGPRTLALNPTARAYLTNSANGGLFVGAGLLYLHSDLLPAGSELSVVPSLGASLPAGPSVRAVPEIALVPFANSPNQLSISLAFQFLLNGPTDTLASVFRFEKGSVMWGTSVSGLAMELERNGGLSLGLTPEVHYFLSESAALGIRGKYTSRRVRNPNRSTEPEYTLAGGLSLRLFPKNTGRLTPFLQFGANYNRTSRRDGHSAYSQYSITRTYLSYDAGVGTLIFLRPGIALETGFNYTLSKAGYVTLPADDNVLGFTLGGRFLY